MRIFEVYNSLGRGFLERVYQKALELEFANRGIRAVPQAPLKVTYKGTVVGEYFADFLVEDVVLVEIKACERLLDEHHAQVINYLRATSIELGLLLNFGPQPEVRRKICQTERNRQVNLT